MMHVRRAVILLYHRIADPDQDPFSLCVPVDEFRRQMTHVRNTCEPVTLDQLATAIIERAQLDRAVAITFDDGYVDNLTVASPVLSDLGIPATFFVTTAAFAERRTFWWDALAQSDVDRRDWPALHSELLQCSLAERDAMLARRLGNAWPAAECAAQPMTSSEIKELASRRGHSIGAHTVNHLSLPRQSTQACRFELEQSKADLEALLSVPITAVAYPFGAVSAAVIERATKAGYATGFGVSEQAVDNSADIMALARWQVPSQASQFVAQLDRLFESTA